MNRSDLHVAQLRGVALAAAAGLASAAGWAGPPAAAAPLAVAQDDVTLFEMVPGAVYLNGGIGQGEQQQMRRDARNWPLRMTFSGKPSHEFVAGVRLKVLDHDGRAVLRLRDAGPMTYVQVPPGDYRISASYKGERLTRTVHVGPRGIDANFHWAI